MRTNRDQYLTIEGIDVSLYDITAWHEAGHAAATLASDVILESCSVRNAATKWKERVRGGERTTMREIIFVSAAGYHAEVYYLTSLGIPEDTAHSVAAQGAQGDIQSIAEHLRFAAFGTKKRAAGCWEVTHALEDAVWLLIPRIQRIAEALIERPRTAAEIRRLYRGAGLRKG